MAHQWGCYWDISIWTESLGFNPGSAPISSFLLLNTLGHSGNGWKTCVPAIHMSNPEWVLSFWLPPDLIQVAVVCSRGVNHQVRTFPSRLLPLPKRKKKDRIKTSYMLTYNWPLNKSVRYIFFLIFNFLNHFVSI